MLDFEFPHAVGLAPKHLKEMDGSWRFEHKLDGQRRVLCKWDGRIYAFGRRDSIVTGQKENVIDRLGKRIRAYAESLPEGTIIDGEVIPPAGQSTDVSTFMKDDSELLDYKAFGILKLRGDRVDWEVEAAQKMLSGWGIPLVHSDRLDFDAGELYLPIRHGDWDAAFLDMTMRAMNLKVEGFILKKYCWGPFYKFKSAETYDLIVTGSTDANYGVTGKYFGQIGALLCSAYVDGKLVEVCKCSGMTDAQRLQFTQKLPLGEVVEVKAQCVAGKGRLRHPRFIRMRPDKNPSECKASWLEKRSSDPSPR